ncbi:putative Orphan nuclear receptor NR6A1 [Operophtera brumata]|nr:putative Orphan nuclear receptor NR6A1 [Operophtera brumata]
MAVRWVRCLAPFQALAASDQLVLLRAAWKDLFLLHLAQWSAPWDLAPMLGAPAARNTPGLSETQPVEMLQDQAQCILADYVRTRYTRQPTR